jgi:MFS family permease
MFGSILFFLTLYLQEVLDLKPLETGVVFLTFTVPLVALPPLTGRMVTKYGPQVLMAVGEALITVGMVCFLFLDASSGLGLVILGLVIAGVGQGFSFNISNSAGMEAIPDDKAGIGSGVLSLVRLLGIIVGLALSGALFKGVENNSLVSSFQSASGKALSAADKAEIRGLLSGSDAAIHKLATLAPQLHNQVEDIVNKAFVHGLHAVMLASIIVCALSVPAALWGRAQGKKGALHLPHLAHPLWPHLWKREPVES